MTISLSSHLLGCLVRELNYGPWPVTVCYGDVRYSRTALFWVIMQQVMVIFYGCCRTTCQSQPQGSRIQKKAICPNTEFIYGRVWAVKMSRLFCFRFSSINQKLSFLSPTSLMSVFSCVSLSHRLEFLRSQSV
jgi:hypothetical protein